MAGKTATDSLHELISVHNPTFFSSFITNIISQTSRAWDFLLLSCPISFMLQLNIVSLDPICTLRLLKNKIHEDEFIEAWSTVHKPKVKSSIGAVAIGSCIYRGYEGHKFRLAGRSLSLLLLLLLTCCCCCLVFQLGGGAMQWQPFGHYIWIPHPIRIRLGSEILYRGGSL